MWSLLKLMNCLLTFFAIVAPATFVKEEVYLFINRKEDFCGKVFVTSDVAFIRKVLHFGFFSNRRSWPVRMLDSPKMYLLTSV